MPSSQKPAPPALSALPTPSQSLHDSSNAGKFVESRGNSFFLKRLTRQKNLRHPSDDELGLQVKVNGSSRSPDSARRKSFSPDGSNHWSLSASPKPLPLPELVSNGKPKSGPANLGSPPGEGTSFIGRRNNDRDARNQGKLPANFARGFSQDVPESVGNGQRLGNPNRITTKNRFLSPPVSPRGSSTRDFFGSYDVDSTKSLFNRRLGLSNDMNTVSLNYNLMLDVPARSAPTSVFSSPSVSPRRSNAGDVFNSPFGNYRDEFHGLIALDLSGTGKPHAYSLPVSSSQRSPNVRSPPTNGRSPNRFPLPPPAGAHPLPLPPGALQPSQPSVPPIGPHVTERSFSPSMKGQWQKGRLIGRGTYGSVYVATNRITGALCAMKEVDVIPDDSKSLECIKQLEQEIKVLKQLEHPNIVQYYGSETIDDHFYIYLELVHPGSLNKYVREHCGNITESIVRNFTRHILSGLAYLHGKKTIHRDIKGANLLVNSSGVVKLADFGMAKHLTGLSYELSLKGSPYWMAPEVIKAVMQKDGDPDLALAVDIWSLGCTVIEMFNGKPPWSELEGPQAMFKVLNRTPPIPEGLSPQGRDFLQLCFRRNPAERPSAARLLEHPFVCSSADQHVSPLIRAFTVTHRLSHAKTTNCASASHSPRCSTTLEAPTATKLTNMFLATCLLVLLETSSSRHFDDSGRENAAYTNQEPQRRQP